MKRERHEQEDMSPASSKRQHGRKLWMVLLLFCGWWAGAFGVARAEAIVGHPALVAVGESSAAETQQVRQLAEAEAWRWQAWENFLTQHPESVWQPAVRNHLAELYRTRGYYTRALAHWEAAWRVVRGATNGPGKAVGERTLAHWSQLLASLGRTEQLGELFQETAGRVFEDVALRGLWQNSREGYDLMLRSPGVSYRCGTFALRAVGQRLAAPNRFNALLNEPSPAGGFSLTRLRELAESNRLDLVAVARPAGATNLVVPAVVHWRQNHYAAILAREGDLYWVSDPTFSQGDWMTAAVVNEEASGNFLVPAAQVPPEWRHLAVAEADQIFGKGQPHNVKDWRDEGCDKSPGTPPAGDCPPCVGMPVWWVSEPYLNLWLADEPLSYRTSYGENFPFRWTYKQRDAYYLSGTYYLPRQSAAWRNLGMTNATWSHNWLSSIRFRDTAWDAGWPYDCENLPGLRPSYTYYEAVVYLPGGGVRVYAKTPVGDQLTEARSQVRLEPLAGSRPTNGGAEQSYCGNTGTNGFKLVYPDGAEDHYALSFKKRPGNCISLSESEALLTRRIDAQGRQTFLCYESVARSNPFDGNVVRVKHLIDPDGRTNTFTYSSTIPDLVTGITDPYGRTAQFDYDGNGRLTSIVDAVNLTNTFQYRGGDGIITNLTTLYGSTGFEHYEAFEPAQGNYGGHNLLNRYVRVTEPGGGKHLFVYRYDSASLVPATYPTSEVPTNVPLVLDTSALNFRNSYHWGPRQYNLLSTTVPTNFIAADYQLARQNHWLDSDEVETVSDRISLRREPTPDGVTAGQKTWFSYEGKDPGAPQRVGTEAQVGLVARVLPDGSTRYEYQLYGANGWLSAQQSTYTALSGAVGLRSRFLFYAANGIDVQQVIGPQFSVEAAFGYNTNHQVTRVTNALQQVASFDYDPTTRQLLSLTNVSGQTAALTYYPSDATDPNGGFLQSIQWNPGPTWTFGYEKGLVKAATNDAGLWLTFTWDDLLRLTGTVFPDGTYTSNRYHRLDLVATRDRLGHWTTAGYDAMQRPTAITNANNAVTRLDWCGCGALESITDALTNLTQFYYNNQGVLTNRTTRNAALQSLASLTYAYDAVNQLTSVRDGLNRALTFGYNNQGLLTTVSNASGLLERRVYDVLDRPVQITDAHHVTVTNTFDLLNRLTRRVWPDGFGESYGWSTNGLVAYTNRNQQVTRFTRDAAGRLLAVTNANLEVTRFTYNTRSQLTDLWDGLNQNTHWTYDEYGLPRTKTDALSRTAFQWDYNPNGWLTNQTTPQFGSTSYAYDNAGNLTASSSLLTSSSYQYNALNQLTNVVDGIGATKLAWNALGQLLSEDGPWADDTVSYSYTEGLRTGMSINSQPSTINFSYGYDAAWRMTSVSSPAGAFGYAFPLATRHPSLVTLPNLATITNHFDALGRLDQIALKNKWGHTLDGYSYAHDLISLRTNVTRNLGWTASTVDVGYDQIGQLTTWNAKEPGGTPRLNEQLGWKYDAANNLRYRTNGALLQTFTSDNANQLSTLVRTGPLTVTGNTPSPATNVTVSGPNGSSVAERYGDYTFATATGLTLNNGANSFTNIAHNAYGLKVTNVLNTQLPTTLNLSYDLNGNLTNDGTRSFSYDPHNRLTTNWVAGQWKTEFVYDGFGRRRITRDYGWSSGWVLTNETRLLYDGLLPIQERNASNNPLVTYTRGLDLSGSLHGAGGIGGLLARTEHLPLETSHSFYHSDGSGNVTALMNSDGDILARYLYNPFGKLIGKWGPLADANVMRFSSMPEHRGLALYTFRAYDPNLQRWLTQDPSGEGGGLNLFSFVANDPVNLVDDWGMQPRPVNNNNHIPGVVPNPAINAQIRADMQASGRTHHQLQFEWMRNEALLNRNARDRNQRYFPTPQNTSGRPELRSLVPRPPRPPTQLEMEALVKDYLRRNPSVLSPCPPGTQVTRNWGGEAGPFGRSWTRDPVSRQSRDSLGLGEWNTGEFISTGVVVNSAGITTRPALPAGNYRGLGDEVIIPNPISQVRLNSVVMPDNPIQ